MRNGAIAATLLVALTLASQAPCATATFTIDKNRQYQTIRGWGGMVYADQASLVPTLVNELGINTARFELSGFNTAEVQITETGLVNAMKTAGIKYFIATPWSSPSAYEKANNAYDSTKASQWVDWWIGRVKEFKRLHNRDLFAASIQNEPSLGPAFYDVTMYQPLDMRGLVRRIGPRLVQEGLPTKVFWSEELVSGNWRNYLDAVATDTSAVGGSQYAPYYAVHGYDANGITAASGNASVWIPVGTRITETRRKEAWLTETSGWGEGTHWENAMKWVSFFYSTLKYGRLSLYVHHYLTLDNYDESRPYTYFIEDNRKLKIFYAAKQFWSFIKEGSKQLDCATSDTSIAAPVAFAHPDNRTLVLAFVNPKSEAVTFSLVGEGIPTQFRKYVTTATLDCADQGTVSSSSLSLPANSIMTLVGDNYSFNVVGTDEPRRSSARPAAVRPGAGPGVAYTVDGRWVGDAGVHGQSAGATATGVLVVKTGHSSKVVARDSRPR